ncbi:hypothetical protein U1Q18_020122 [Sarracenia purpurea var. burkii]
MEAATEAPAERTTVLAFVDTVLRQEDIIFKEFGNKPLLLPFPFFILHLNPSQPPTPPPPTHQKIQLPHCPPPPPKPTTIANQLRSSDTPIPI